MGQKIPKTTLDYENLNHNVVCFKNGLKFGGGLREFSRALENFSGK